MLGGSGRNTQILKDDKEERIENEGEVRVSIKGQKH